MYYNLCESGKKNSTLIYIGKHFLPIFLSVPKILKLKPYFIEEKIFINPSYDSSKTITTDVLIGSNKLSSKPKEISTDFLSGLTLAFGIETDFIFFVK